MPSCRCCRALTGHAHLVRLGLCCDPLSDAGLASLTYLTQLTELGLVRAHLLGGERLTGVLGRLPQLKVGRGDSVFWWDGNKRTAVKRVGAAPEDGLCHNSLLSFGVVLHVHACGEGRDSSLGPGAPVIVDVP
jgi:hypothetical protein